jgi:hypothetical protein
MGVGGGRGEMNKLEDLDGALLTRMYCEQQMTISQMVAIFHTDRRALKNRLLAVGIQPRTRSEARNLFFRRHGKPGTPGPQVLAEQYWERGRSTVDIARDLGVKSNTVQHYMDQAGIARRSFSECKKKMWSEEGFRERMIRENNSMWRGGRCKINGYVLVLMPEHPDATKAGYILEHRLVMEKMVGRRLRPEERVHHRNHVKTDNRPENLELFSNPAEHTNHHILERDLTRLGGFAVIQAFDTWLKRSCTWRLA